MNDRRPIYGGGGARSFRGEKPRGRPLDASTIIDDADRKLIIHCSRPVSERIDGSRQRNNRNHGATSRSQLRSTIAPASHLEKKHQRG